MTHPSKTTRQTRRRFLQMSATIAIPTIIPSKVLGGLVGKTPPSERATIGLISCGDRSSAASSYMNYTKSEVLAVCDPIQQRRENRSRQFNNCAMHTDFRELLARDDLDAVHISTPDHWHVPIALAAARAGKDLYTEKPLGLSIEEDLAARAIVDKHQRIFQYGTQNRSMSQVRMGIELVLNGHIGAVEEVYVWCPPGASGGSPIPELPIPAGFDYNLWQGPAEERPFSTDRCYGSGGRKGIYHIYDYALGFIAGWGAHPMDQMQWWADQAGLKIPVTYEGNGTLPQSGLFNTLTHWDVRAQFANGLPLHFQDDVTARHTRRIPGIKDMRFTHGTLFKGSNGWVAVSRGSWKVSDPRLYQIAKNPGKKRLTVSHNHQEQFVDCVLDRKQPIADLHSAVRSDMICQLSNICIRTGRKIMWNEKTETIVDDAEAQKLTRRAMRKPWTL